MKKYVFKKKTKKILMAIIDIIGFIIFFPFKIIKKKVKNPKKILVVRLDQIGDMVQALPFFDAVKKKYTGAGIYALCAKQTEFLLKERKDIEKIFTVENSWFYKEKKVNLKEIIFLIREIKKENIDMAFDLRGDIRNIFLLFLCGIKHICGYGCTGGGFLLDCEKKYDREMHEINKNLFLIDEKANDYIKINFEIPKENIEETKKFLKENGISKNNKLIVIHPFSRAKTRFWGFEKFSALIKKISIYNNIKIIILGAKSEKEFSEKFLFNDKVIDCIGRFAIWTTIAIIKEADIFIGCNSSLQYFAAYSNIKTCVIYGYSTPDKRWLPKIKKENFIAFSKPVDCGPCELDECPENKKHRCMEIITVDEVYNAIKKWLD